MPSLISRAVPAYLRITRANRPFITAQGAREHIRERSIRPQPYGPPRLLRSDVRVEVRREDGWPIYTLTPRTGGARGNIVYCHGGGWINEVARQHWELAATIAAEMGTAVTLPIYPLIPYGTADEVIPRFAALVRANRAEYGEVCLAGDSAGGQIALSTALVLRDEEQPIVPRTVLISPALDLSLSNPDIPAVQPDDPWLGREGGLVLGEHWRGPLPITDPRVSPMFGDFTGLGPLTVFSGTRDILMPDIRIVVGKARAAGVEVDYHEAAGLVHVYPLTPTPEARAARAILIDSLRAALSRAPSPR
ncbi:alpha/beta hydrolase fold domain-containing protein [Nocardia seriolae]|uniref:Alpha/beta hydrolase n=1 Tax=Nocardia seriolae TaxID=37332 RepID=A0A0B8NPB3_9NOCA|nr:alpha/beta hydrolase [Nocardia seriolae]APB00828.1 Cyclohexanone monooxygenase [Nocardia seriolae]MTJ65379.1 alpha/beta hydrolase fold domain-containing protein [Nocardia seriolae]MTJ75187.1 alpha/beta hydrolase fold domain-containing protein [Nocardia seriolae]MTJ90264.1 alpha/beta hydrolase fold domain-containing protein [Nocardia seriolae]MTK34227.1 alpha/beta hydrolase fold domain-containing protein [Nocardia seriolae]